MLSFRTKAPRGQCGGRLWGTCMKRLLIILGLLALLLDLADDGSVGKAKLVAPQDSSGIVELQGNSPEDFTAAALHPAYQADLSGRFQYQPVAVTAFHPCKTVYSCSFFSSGGIPS